VVFVSERCREITVRIHYVAIVYCLVITLRTRRYGVCGLSGGYSKDNMIGEVEIVLELLRR
jgi:hypothetical protein